MLLGTTDEFRSIALALIPPGNVLRELSSFRGSIFRLSGVSSARAWFDFPVLAWLDAVPDSADLVRCAHACVEPLQFSHLVLRGNALYLSMPDSSIQAFSTLQPAMPPASESCVPGPFEAGIGVFCAGFASQNEAENALLQCTAPAVGVCETYLLSVLELSWSKGPDMGCSWSVRASARSGPRGKNSKPLA